MSAFSAKGRPWLRLRAQVLAESDICWLCGCPGSESVDHIIPLAAGGLALDPENLRPAHKRCNSRRGAKLPGESPPSPRSRNW